MPMLMNHETLLCLGVFGKKFIANFLRPHFKISSCIRFINMTYAMSNPKISFRALNMIGALMPKR